MDGAEARGGATLLHRAVRSGSAPLLEGLLAWGAAHAYQWKVQQHFPHQKFHSMSLIIRPCQDPACKEASFLLQLPLSVLHHC